MAGTKVREGGREDAKVERAARVVEVAGVA